MAFSINGDLFKNGTVHFPTVVNGDEVKTVVYKDASGSHTVFQQYVGPASPIVVTSSTALIAGVDFPANTDLTICMCGGGGGGDSYNDGYMGGGYAGQVKSEVHNVPYNESVSITIGAGGHNTNDNGTNGGISSFSDYVSCYGGTGGKQDNSSCIGFCGNGGRVTTCGGTGTTGTYKEGAGAGHDYYYCYGGQSSGFGDGLNAMDNGSTAGVGSGSCGAAQNVVSYGGRGEVRISW